MTFIWPNMLLSLILIPLLVTLYLRIQQHRKRTAQRFGSLPHRRAAHTELLRQKVLAGQLISWFHAAVQDPLFDLLHDAFVAPGRLD